STDPREVGPMKPHGKAISILAALVIIAVPAGCGSIGDDERQWLTEKARNSLVFVEGGTFRMGDVGYKDKDGNFHYFTGDADTVPVHQVTLDSFSIQKHETTFAEF